MAMYGAGPSKLTEMLVRDPEKLVFDIETVFPKSTMRRREMTTAIDPAAVGGDYTAVEQRVITNSVKDLTVEMAQRELKVDLVTFSKMMFAQPDRMMQTYHHKLMERLLYNGGKPYADSRDSSLYDFIVYMINRDGTEVVPVNKKNVSDYEKHGYSRVPEGACEVCRSLGRVRGEECWHCEGHGVDPVLGI